jgi:hypothetical protein
MALGSSRDNYNQWRCLGAGFPDLPTKKSKCASYPRPQHDRRIAAHSRDPAASWVAFSRSFGVPNPHLVFQFERTFCRTQLHEKIKTAALFVLREMQQTNPFLFGLPLNFGNYQAERLHSPASLTVGAPHELD